MLSEGRRSTRDAFNAAFYVSPQCATRSRLMISSGRALDSVWFKEPKPLGAKLSCYMGLNLGCNGLHCQWPTALRWRTPPQVSIIKALGLFNSSDTWFQLFLSHGPPKNHWEALFALLRPTPLIELNNTKETHWELSVVYIGSNYWISFQHWLPDEMQHGSLLRCLVNADLIHRGLWVG